MPQIRMQEQTSPWFRQFDLSPKMHHFFYPPGGLYMPKYKSDRTGSKTEFILSDYCFLYRRFGIMDIQKPGGVANSLLIMSSRPLARSICA